jgi:hypothetical protein
MEIKYSPADGQSLGRKRVMSPPVLAEDVAFDLIRACP